MNIRKNRPLEVFERVSLVVLLSLVACASKPKRTEYPYPLSGPTQSTPGGTAVVPPVPGAEGIPQGEGPKRYTEPPAVTLVLGGAGVASFAAVGIFKKFQEVGIRIEQIITTGWPTVFSLGLDYLRSVHDVEWFATRLQDKDFNKSGFFELNRGAPDDRVSPLIESTFGSHDISETQQKVPVLISIPSSESREGDVVDRGDWREPVARSLSFPGVYRSFAVSNLDWIDAVQGLNVEEAKHRGARVIVAVSMYDDYFAYLKSLKKQGDEAAFKKKYLSQMAKSVQEALGQADVKRHIALKRSPDDFGAKRAAIQAGYREAAQLIKEIRRLP